MQESDRLGYLTFPLAILAGITVLFVFASKSEGPSHDCKSVTGSLVAIIASILLISISNPDGCGGIGRWLVLLLITLVTWAAGARYQDKLGKYQHVFNLLLAMMPTISYMIYDSSEECDDPEVESHLERFWRYSVLTSVPALIVFAFTNEGFQNIVCGLTSAPENPDNRFETLIKAQEKFGKAAGSAKTAAGNLQSDFKAGVEGAKKNRMARKVSPSPMPPLPQKPQDRTIEL